MDLGLAGRVVIVTGGASGIGAAVARGLAAEGAAPAILSREPPPAALARALEGGEGGWLAIEVELTDDAACAAAVARVADRFGRLDGLVNNAGRNDHVGLGAGPAAFRASLDANLVQAYAVAHHAAPHLRAARGAIVNVASKVGLTGQGGTSAYAAAKAGLLGLTREWAADLAPSGVRVNAVVPAEAMTPNYEAILAAAPDPAAARARIEGTIPLGRRFTTAEEVADAVLFALSARAGHMTGQWLFVDGGYTHLDRALTVP